jgi:hypothetical protein
VLFAVVVVGLVCCRTWLYGIKAARKRAARADGLPLRSRPPPATHTEATTHPEPWQQRLTTAAPSHAP